MRIALLTFLLVAPAALAQNTNQLWSANCAACHGDKAQGVAPGAPSACAKSLLDPVFCDAPDRDLYDSVAGGKSHAKLDGYSRLPNPQAWALVVHLRELQAREARRRTPAAKPVDGVYSSRLHNFKLDAVVATGLDTPWAIEFLPDGALLITERPGRLRIFQAGKLSEPVAGTPAVRNRGQGGLLDVALHPNFKDNAWIYLAYSDKIGTADDSPGMTKIVRGHISMGKDSPTPDSAQTVARAVWTDQQTIFEARHEHYIKTDHHFGSRIAFDPKDPTTLFFCIGERGQAPNAQDLSRPNGKVHRVKDDGQIPADDPFAANDKAYASIWSLGHRNPQGLCFDAAGTLWETEHGPRGGDELNRIERGHNYGWPVISLGMNYSGEALTVPWPDQLPPPKAAETRPEFTLPMDRWLPSIAACGLACVRGDAFPKWNGDLLAGGLAGATLQRIHIEAGNVTEREELLYGLGRVRDVAVAPDGSVYVVLNGPDKIIRLYPSK